MYCKNNSKIMVIIRKGEIESALAAEYRQYVAGHLARPQPDLGHADANVEIGMSEYKEFTADAPHVHPVQTEFGLVLKGAVKLLMMESGTEYELSEGDFIVVRPGEAHATKNAPGTRTLFVKEPSLNDKQVIEPDERLEKWMSSWDERWE